MISENPVSFRRIYAIFLRQLFLLRQSPPRIMGVFYWSTFEILLWGIITKYLYTVGGEKLNFITVIVGAIIFWNFFNRVQQGISVSFLEDVWSRNLINLFSSPLSVGEYITGLILTSVINTILSFVGMFFVAWFFFSYNIFQFGFLLLPFIFILFIFGWALGIMITALVLRFGSSIEMLVWAIAALIMPLSSIFYPISALPKIVQPIAYGIPISYVFEGMRQAVNHGTFDMIGLTTAFFLSIVYLASSVWFFVRMYRTVLKKGLFTRFMTE